MSEAYAISDLIICRSGALTISELTVWEAFHIIPFSHAAGDHQTKNAQVVDSNAAKLYRKNLIRTYFILL